MPTVHPRTKEGVLRRRDEPLGQLGAHRLASGHDGAREVLTEGRTKERERGRGETGLHDRLLVGKRKRDEVVDEIDQRRARVPHETDGSDAAPDAGQELKHLGGRARARDRHDGVIAAIDERLGGRERICDAVAGGLTQHGIRLRHEPAGTAADDRDALPCSGEHGPLGCEPDRPLPRVGLRRELGLHVHSDVRAVLRCIRHESGLLVS